MTQSADFISQIPDGVLQKTEVHPCSGSIMLFKPMIYMGDVTFRVTDYHIVIPSEDTPGALFNNQMIHVNRQKILAVNPGDTVTCLDSTPAKPYYSFLIRPNLLEKIAEDMGFSGKIRFKNFLNPFSAELFQAFRNLDREAARPDRLHLMLDSLEVQIAVLLLRKFRTNLKTAVFPLQDADSYVRLASEYIRTYSGSNISLKDICEEIHVSQYHFIRMFGRETGMTPHKYLLTVRIEKAKELLRTGRYSVSETAVLCGFETIPHFSATFKKFTGVSPVNYKNQ